MQFSVKELLQAGSHKWKESEVDIVILRNLEDLCRKVNALGYKPPMRASSCLRSIKDQQRINPKAMGSSHLYGCAVDIADPDGKLKSWLQTEAGNLALINCGLWAEDYKSTPTWIHLSTYCPKSMNRVFRP